MGVMGCEAAMSLSERLAWFPSGAVPWRRMFRIQGQSGSRFTASSLVTDGLSPVAWLVKTTVQ